MKRYYRFVGEQESGKGKYVIFVIAITIAIVTFWKVYSEEHPKSYDEEWTEEGTGITIIESIPEEFTEDTEDSVNGIPEFFFVEEEEPEVGLIPTKEVYEDSESEIEYL